MNKIHISIVIVHYRVKGFLFTCIDFIYKRTKANNFEIIVVDNDEQKTIFKDLKKRFPKVKYIPNKNRGFAQGNNRGAKIAKGKYLFFLNPDTEFLNDAIKNLSNFLDKNEEVGIAAPLLLDRNEKPYSLQGTQILTPFNALFAYSFLNKFFPNNYISRQFWKKGWDKTRAKEVEVVPGTAFMISSELFNKLGGFDEDFFLFFEEYDICRRVKKEEMKIYIIPNARVLHLWGESTKKSERNLKDVFNKSRFYYFRKHFGLLNALLVSSFLGINKQNISLLGILCLGAFLSLNRISELMPFIGDQAWFYLSARDLALGQSFPLVGITSSHTWLHQGPLWTYMLAPVLLISNFNPIWGAYLTAFIGILSIFLIYKVGSNFVSAKFGLISALIYATSPLVIFHLRLPYHTSPIPLFVLLLFYSLIKWVKGNPYYFPLILFSMSVLYNLEIATIVFWPVIILYTLFGFFGNKNYLKKLYSRKIVIISLLALFVPMIPILIYDVQNGFPQTIKLSGWIGYKVLQLIGIIERNKIDNNSIVETFNFFFSKYEALTVSLGKYTAYSVFFLSLLIPLFKLRKESIASPISIIFFLTMLGVVSFFASNVSSEAYLVMLFPGLIFLFVNLLFQIRNNSLMHLALIFIVSFNVIQLITTNYLMYNRTTIQKKLDASNKILELAGDKKYNIIYKGVGEEFESSRMPYEYLTWWIADNSSVDRETELKIVVRETDQKIHVERGN